MTVLTKHQLYLVKEAQQEAQERTIKGWGGRIKIYKHGGFDNQTGLKNCSCCN